MNTLIVEKETLAQSVSFARDMFTVALNDGRILTVPLAWFPRLMHGTAAERAHYRLIGNGSGINWPALDEDISVEGLLLGRPSAENPKSLERWLSKRKNTGRHRR
ncbi:MAG: DUF2442 domain-containing protein [Planctomycetota bacterium]